MRKSVQFTIVSLATLSLLALLFGCATPELSPEQARHIQNEYDRENCNFEAAYASGMNDARANKDMNTSPAQGCSSKFVEVTRRGYREGYTIGARSRPKSIQITVGNPEDVKSLPGYECKKDFSTDTPVCGFNCIRNFGKYYCGSRPEHKCVESGDNVKCGVNCKRDFGEVKCD